MTDLQDDICDALVGARIGPGWVGGPLHVAALVVDPAFVPWHRPDGQPRHVARTVGWPLVFCEAAMGANLVLKTEAERRALAITLFSRIPVAPAGGKASAMPGARSRPAAAWAVLRGHESACGLHCPLHAATLAVLADAGAGRAWTSPFDTGVECRGAPGLHGRAVTAKSAPAHHAARAILYLLQHFGGRSYGFAVPDAFRESAKAKTKVRGAEGVAAFCLTLAGKLGLTAG